MADLYIHEFLFRGKPDGATEFHVYLGAVVADPFTGEPGEPILKGPLTLAEAEALGFPLPTILEAVNKQALDELAKAREEIAALQAEIAAQAVTEA